jgi:hypothetical protein
MSNSPLATYTKISPNKNSPRNKPIDTITIHCTAGNKDNTARQIADYFSNASRGASCNYVVGGDGSIAISVEEKDRSWCTSSGANDNRAITIEVCSNIAGTEVNDKAYAALINLVADICKRNGIKKLVWSTDKNSRVNHLNGCNMTVHRDYANKACPGEYLYSRHGLIADEVNKLIKPATKPEQPKPGVLYRVQTGAFSNKANADALLTKVKAKGFDTYMIQDGGLYKVQVGAYSNKANADAQAAKLKAAGFDTYITTKSGAAVSNGANKKSVSEIAHEVIAGKWGNGVERINKLKAVGYNPATVQNEVNKLLKK